MGVKSLWQLLTPVGRPVMLETVEGKAMAIDSSIWIYQFQATMRDKDGRALVNGHVLGFLRRICKLLFYGIKPVFVFDGGAPALKRSTITQRKNKKSGAAESHAKVAEKLLAAQLRREAVNQAQQAQALPSTKAKGKGKAPTGPVAINENTVYLEDIDGSAPKTPKKSPQKKADASTSSPSKNRFYDHDPYRLPDLDLSEVVAKASSSTAPDPRFATEEELRVFIEDLRPGDFDVTSPAFRELPTEVQYEIVGDLRLKSRQTSYKRLQNMLKNASTPLDFSRQQIMNLKQRNSLTQQLLMTTDSIGKAHLTIPVRVASERNREYVLVKNEGVNGGWVLGIRDEGTQAKPIQIDQDDEERNLMKDDDDDSDMEMEEVSIPGAGTVDADLREYQRQMALSAVSSRDTSKELAPLTTKFKQPKRKAAPLFDLDKNESISAPNLEYNSDDGDMELAVAIEQSLIRNYTESTSNDDGTDTPVTRPTSPPSIFEEVSASNKSPLLSSVLQTSRTPPINRTTRLPSDDVDDDLYYVSPTNLETALAIANAGPVPKPVSRTSQFGVPSSLLTPMPAKSMQPHVLAPQVATPHKPSAVTISDSENGKEEVDIGSEKITDLQSPVEASTLPTSNRSSSAPAQVSHPNASESDNVMEEVDVDKVPFFSPVEKPASRPRSPTPVPFRSLSSPIKSSIQVDVSSDDDDMEEVVPSTLGLDSFEHEVAAADVFYTLPPRFSNSHEASSHIHLQPLNNSTRGSELDEDDIFSDWSRSPSPSHQPLTDAQPSTALNEESWDAAQEMDPRAEAGEFARFLSQVRGRDLDDVRREIDDEIRGLHQQKKVAMRDSEDITQQMIAQIMLMLRLFGIPYITAPMEAEAQCATLVALGLVDGVITDDSDVFLFGGARVFKNMFNQSRTVECFLLADLARELGLDRGTLVRLAYLLGSDYVDGLPGVGPVVAMELLREFPGEDGLHKFKDWWTRVQMGKDTPQESNTRFRKRFKKRFKELYLPSEWPNSAVRDAYYYPTVDTSEEPFKWGLPDLDALRDFFKDELGWNQTKVNDLLLPIIQKIGKRNQAAALNKQGNLDEYIGVSAGMGVSAPRKRQAYQSKRLQEVVAEFRKAGKAAAAPGAQGGGGAPEDVDADEEEEEQGPPKKKAKSDNAKGKAKAKDVAEASRAKKTGTAKGRGRGRSRGRGRGRGTSGRGREKDSAEKESSANDEQDEDAYEKGKATVEGTPPPLAVELRPRPKPRPLRRNREVDETPEASHQPVS